MLRYLSVVILVITFFSSPVSNARPAVTFYTESYPPFQSLNPQGELVGFSIDVLHATQQYLDFDINIQIMPWNRAYKNAAKNPDTFIFSIGKSEKRLQQFKWVSDFYTVQNAIYKKASRSDINIDSKEDINRYTLALPRGDISLDSLNIQHKHPNVYLVSNQTKALKMLYFERVDLINNNNIGLSGSVKALGLKQSDFTVAYVYNNVELGLATHKETRIELLEMMQHAFDTIKQNGQFELLVKKWFPEPVSQQTATQVVSPITTKPDKSS
ncbi:hypothetical protein CXF78_03080 [Shewanella sp. 11B5]|uniref:substrate-binding periplasmic protein n=1 Tax=Shewanella sp. 11B5 TaxID=2058298 RepID=UPI000C7D3BFC|nr:transporter substrate-binding domain-containing protein [Shewanella sp. 11B5]PKI07916.1 hypothetical protein CXF78_03080 [Shewanella sp. 11B5]